MPIITTLVTRRSCSRSIRGEHQHLLDDLALASGCGPAPSTPVAQNVHLSGQPDWDETHTVERSRWRIATVSTGKPSGSSAAA